MNDNQNKNSNKNSNQNKNKKNFNGLLMLLGWAVVLTVVSIPLSVRLYGRRR